MDVSNNGNLCKLFKSKTFKLFSLGDKMSKWSIEKTQHLCHNINTFAKQ